MSIITERKRDLPLTFGRRLVSELCYLDAHFTLDIVFINLFGIKTANRRLVHVKSFEGTLKRRLKISFDIN